jgi:hypothetical protein
MSVDEEPIILAPGAPLRLRTQRLAGLVPDEQGTPLGQFSAGRT